MARYTDEDQAAADGFRIVHEPDRHRYAVYEREPAAAVDGDGSGVAGGAAAARAEADRAPGRLVGEAHYTLLGDDAIDFDHTVVLPELRGTGLSGLLAQHALRGDAPRGRRVHASCWFIEGYLARHPELLRDGCA